MLFLQANNSNAKLATQECLEANINGVRKALCATVMAPFDAVGVVIPVTGFTLSVAGAAAGAIVEAPITIPWAIVGKTQKPSDTAQYNGVLLHNKANNHYSAPQYYGAPQYYNNY